MVRWIVVIGALCLQGCPYFTDITYFRPSGEGQLQVSSCIPVADSISVPITDSVRLLLMAQEGTFTGQRYSDHPGTTLFGELYVPEGARVVFMSSTFAVRADGGTPMLGTISDIERWIPYQRKRGGASSSATQTLSHRDTLVGWSPDDARSSGLIPLTSHLPYETYNKFRFFVPLEDFVAPVFTTSFPDMAVNGKTVSERSVVFTLTEKRRVLAAACP